MKKGMNMEVEIGHVFRKYDSTREVQRHGLE